MRSDTTGLEPRALYTLIDFLVPSPPAPHAYSMLVSPSLPFYPSISSPPPPPPPIRYTADTSMTQMHDSNLDGEVSVDEARQIMFMVQPLSVSVCLLLSV